MTSEQVVQGKLEAPVVNGTNSNNSDLTFSVGKDGIVIVSDKLGNTTRYTKESDLLAVKGSKVNNDKSANELQAAVNTANELVEAEHQKVLFAEAQVMSLKEQLAKGEGSAAELSKAKAELETAKKSGEESEKRLLTITRDTMVNVYGVSRSVVDGKNLSELAILEEAVKAVRVGAKNGNFAIGTTSGGGGTLSGKTPMELALMAYSSSNKK